MNGSRELIVAHHHPGRLRLRSRAFEGDGAAPSVANASAALGAVNGVRDVRVNAVSGSILVLYDPESVDASALVDTAAQSAGVVVGSGRPKPGDEDRLAYIAIDVVREINVIVQELTHHRADLRVLVPAALMSLGVVAAVKQEARLPSWDNLLFWSYSVFVAVNKREINRGTKHEHARGPSA